MFDRSRLSHAPPVPPLLLLVGRDLRRFGGAFGRRIRAITAHRPVFGVQSSALAGADDITAPTVVDVAATRMPETDITLVTDHAILLRYQVSS